MANNMMMSADNPFGLRPDEVVGAITGGYVNVAPTVSQMQEAISVYNQNSSIDYTAPEVGLFNRLAEALNKPVQQAAAVVQPVTQTVQGLAQPVVQGLANLPVISLPQVPGQQLANPADSLLPTAGISNEKIEQYITLGVMFLVVSSIISLFRR